MKRKQLVFILFFTGMFLTALLSTANASTSLDDFYNDTNLSTFDIRLDVITSDYPTVSIGLRHINGTKIYGDKNGFEKTGIWIKKGEGGRYFARYNTESIYFPDPEQYVEGYEWEEIEPEKTGEFIIKIYSSPRRYLYYNIKDDAGIDLSIFNDTDLPAHVIIYNDDKFRPRVKIGAKQGKLLVNGEERSFWPDHKVFAEKIDDALTDFFQEFGISSIALSPDGQKAAYGYLPHAINIFDIDTEKVEQQYINEDYTDDNTSPKGISFSPDGGYIAYGYANDIILRNAADGSEIYTIKGSGTNIDGHSSTVNSVAISSDGQKIISGSEDKTVKVWNSQDGSLLFTLQGHTDAVSNVAISSDGKTIASGSSDNTIKLWNAEDGTLLRTLQGHTGKITEVAISAGGIVASSSADHTVKLWNMLDGTLLHTFDEYTAEVNNVSFSADGQMLVSSSSDNTIKIWDTEDFTLVKSMEVNSNTYLARFLPGNEKLISYSDRGISTWEINPVYDPSPTVTMKYPANNSYYKINDSIPIVIDAKSITNPKEVRLYINDQLNTVFESNFSNLPINSWNFGYWNTFNASPGPNSIRAEVEDVDGNVYASETVNVYFEGIVLDKNMLNLEKGGTSETIQANLYLSPGQNWTDMQWKNADDSVTSITQDGMNATITPIAYGGDAITAVLKDGENIISSAMSMVIVEDNEIESIDLNKTQLKLSENGNSVTIDAQVIPKSDTFDIEKADLLWSTSDASIVSVESNGTSAIITPLSRGNAIINVSDGTLSASCEVNVISGPIVDKAYLTADADMSKVINIIFSKAVKEGIDFNNIVLKDAEGNIIAAEKSITSGSLIVRTNSLLVDGKDYTVNLPANSITDLSDNPLLEDYSYTFTSVPPFNQNEVLGGNQASAYDIFGIQPTADNWSKQSRFNLGNGMKQLWNFDAGEEITSSIVIDSENIKYFTTASNLFALDSNGNKLWSFPITKGTTPAIGKDRTIYVGSIDGNLYALNPDGTKKWEHDLSTGYSRIIYGPEIGKDGSIYVGGSDFNLYAINPDGTKKWTYFTSFGEEIISNPFTNTDGDIYIVTSKNNIYSINMEGSLNWVKNIEGNNFSFNSMRIGSDGTVYVIVGYYDTTEHKFKNELIVLEKSGIVRSRISLNNVYDSALGGNGVIYVDTDKKFYAIDQLGNITWASNSSELSWIPFIGADDTIYIASNDGFLYGINQDGTFKSSVSLGFDLGALTIGVGGEIYAASADGKIYGFNTNEDNIQPKIIDTWPKKKGYYLGTDNGIILTFSEDIKPGYNFESITLEEGDGETLSYTTTQIDGKTFKITPNDILEPWKEFYLTIPTMAFADYSNNALDRDYRINFTSVSKLRNIQGEGYQAGLYDQFADQPMSNNWSRQSRFIGSSEPTIKWFKDLGEVISTPLIGRDNIIYVNVDGSLNNKVYALNLDGSIISMSNSFSKELSIGVDGTIQSGELAIAADGTRYSESSNGVLSAYNPDGSEKWSQSIATDIIHPPVIGADGTIYVVTDDKYLIAVNPKGTIKWSFPLNTYDKSSPTIGPDGTIYVHYELYGYYGSYSKLVAIDPEGVKKWEYITNYKSVTWDYLQSPAVGSDGTIYLYFKTYEGAKLVVLNPDGTEKWVYEIKETSNGPSFTLVGADGTIYLTLHNKLIALNPDGTEKWTFSTINDAYAYNPITAVPTIGSDGTIYLSTENGLYAINNITNNNLPLAVRNVKPLDDEVNVDVNQGIEIVFSKGIAEGPNFIDITIKSLDGQSIMFDTNIDESKLYITPRSPLDFFKKYSVFLPSGAIVDKDNKSMDSYSFTFATISEFKNGDGYVSRAYNKSAVQPTAFNWNRQSRFNGSKLLTKNWSYKDGIIYDFKQSPIIDQDGTIYTVRYSNNSDSEFIYFVKSDGTKVGLAEINGGVNPVIGEDGRIYVGRDWYLRALDPNGEIVWQYNTLDYYSKITQITLGSNGVVYVTLDNNRIVAVPTNSYEKWRYSFNEVIVSNPAVSSDETLYITTLSGNLYALNGDGTLKWTYNIGHSIEASPTIGSDGTIYIGADDGKLYAVTPEGNLKWSFTTDGAVKSTAAIGADGIIYFGSKDKKLYALNSDGALKWFFETDGGVVSSPIIGDDGVIYFGSEDSKLYALDPDGNYISSFKTDRAITSSPALGSNGIIYLTSEDGSLYAIGEQLKFFQSQDILGDLNGDMVVDVLDVSLAAQAYGKSDLKVDFNNDGIVDIYDLVEIARQIQ